MAASEAFSPPKAAVFDPWPSWPAQRQCQLRNPRAAPRCSSSFTDLGILEEESGETSPDNVMDLHAHAVLAPPQPPLPAAAVNPSETRVAVLRDRARRRARLLSWTSIIFTLQVVSLLIGAFVWRFGIVAEAGPPGREAALSAAAEAEADAAMADEAAARASGQQPELGSRLMRNPMRYDQHEDLDDDHASAAGLWDEVMDEDLSLDLAAFLRGQLLAAPQPASGTHGAADADAKAHPYYRRGAAQGANRHMGDRQLEQLDPFVFADTELAEAEYLRQAAVQAAVHQRREAAVLPTSHASRDWHDAYGADRAREISAYMALAQREEWEGLDGAELLRAVEGGADESAVLAAAAAGLYEPVRLEAGQPGVSDIDAQLGSRHM